MNPKQKVDTEKTYPIYRFSARWSQLAGDKSYENSPDFKKGLPNGRIWNGTSWTKIYKEEQDIKELEAWLMDWWNKYLLLEKNADKDMKLLYLKVKFFENETWHLTWFCHETFDEGQTNEEVLQSFENFVRRKEELNAEKQRPHNLPEYCLMGAEDRWRWHGSEPDGDGSSHSPAPCRCKYCKEQGMIRIAH